jgi:predicted nuclease with TOPRIM domain
MERSMAAENGWNEWSKHVLKELERLNSNYEALRQAQEEMKADLSRTAGVIGCLEEVRLWKERVDEVLSPTQLETLTKDVQQLKNFKTVAITVWAVLQAATGLGIATLLKLF